MVLVPLCITQSLSFHVCFGPLLQLLNVPQIGCDEMGNIAFIAFALGS